MSNSFMPRFCMVAACAVGLPSIAAADAGEAARDEVIVTGARQGYTPTDTSEIGRAHV